jgi:hypothetical protein
MFVGTCWYESPVQFLIIYIFLYSILSFHGNSIQWSFSQVISNVDVVLIKVSETVPVFIIGDLHDDCCVHILYVYIQHIYIYIHTHTYTKLFCTSQFGERKKSQKVSDILSQCWLPQEQQLHWIHAACHWFFLMIHWGTALNTLHGHHSISESRLHATLIAGKSAKRQPHSSN